MKQIAFDISAEKDKNSKTKKKVSITSFLASEQTKATRATTLVSSTVFLDLLR